MKTIETEIGRITSEIDLSQQEIDIIKEVMSSHELYLGAWRKCENSFMGRANLSLNGYSKHMLVKIAEKKGND